MTTPVAWAEIIREPLGIPESRLIALAIAFGCPDTEAKVNHFKRTGETLEAFTHWYGV